MTSKHTKKQRLLDAPHQQQKSTTVLISHPVYQLTVFCWFSRRLIYIIPGTPIPQTLESHILETHFCVIGEAAAKRRPQICGALAWFSLTSGFYIPPSNTRVWLHFSVRNSLFKASSLTINEEFQLCKLLASSDTFCKRRVLLIPRAARLVCRSLKLLGKSLINVVVLDLLFGIEIESSSPGSEEKWSVSCFPNIRSWSSAYLSMSSTVQMNSST